MTKKRQPFPVIATNSNWAFGTSSGPFFWFLLTVQGSHFLTVTILKMSVTKNGYMDFI